jgi:transcriptional regulator with XRE-family HTH domain
MAGYSSHATLSAIENGRRVSLYKKTLIPICQILQLDPDTLEPIKLPERSAWDELQWIYTHVGKIDRETYLVSWQCKYSKEIKQIPAKEQ